MQERRQPEVIAGRLNGDGTIQAGDGFSAVRNSVGNYTVTFPGNFRVVSMTVTAMAHLIAQFASNSFSATPGAVTFILNNTSGIGTDAPSTFIAVGFQT